MAIVLALTSSRIEFLSTILLEAGGGRNTLEPTSTSWKTGSGVPKKSSSWNLGSSVAGWKGRVDWGSSSWIMVGRGLLLNPPATGPFLLLGTDSVTGAGSKLSTVSSWTFLRGLNLGRFSPENTFWGLRLGLKLWGARGRIGTAPEAAAVARSWARGEEGEGSESSWDRTPHRQTLTIEF